MKEYNFREIEKKWAEKWVKDKTFTPDFKRAKNPYYALFMFPYPSAEGLHIGNFYCFTCTDVMAKYKKLNGFDLFEPFGFDAFGIHSENYALKIGETPQKMLQRTTANFRHQVQAAGLSCDYTREVDTTKPEYYKWTQWIFTKLFEKGLVYQKEALVNWCPGCKTVLSDEQIIDGECERCGTIAEKKRMKQWFFKITAYAQRLLDGLDSMDWSDITKAAQRNWIGRSEGTELEFKMENSEESIKVYTTRVDTIFSAAFVILSPEHDLVQKIATKEQEEEIENYIKQAGAKSDLERIEDREKTGVFTGSYAINPLNNEKIPVWISDFVLAGYGTGAVFGDAHDIRDFEMAKKYGISLKVSVRPENEEEWMKVKNLEVCLEDDGILVNSGEFDGLTSAEARKKITEWLERKGLGKKTVNYKLRDWCISRQRYWGPPIPVVYCEKCGSTSSPQAVAVPEKDLPVRLPELEKGWEPAGDGRGPLAKVESFMKTKCPVCGSPAEREPDVMDNFLDSAWYFFRYISPKNEKDIFDIELGKKWLPVDLYIGGNEHAVLHLMYTRFITMALHDLGVIDFDNPFKRFRANGMIQKDGKKMSKSKGNIINPEEYGEKVGYDALKTYLLFLGPLSEDRSFTDKGVLGCKRWAEKVARLEEKVSAEHQDGKNILRKLHQTIKRISEDFEEQKYNTGAAKLMELANDLGGEEKISADLWKKYLAMAAPFLPALAEELWSRAGNNESIFSGKNWPEFDAELAKNEEIELVVQINGKLRERIKTDAEIGEEDAKKLALQSERIKKLLEGKEVKKVIFVKGKLINIVV